MKHFMCSWLAVLALSLPSLAQTGAPPDPQMKAVLDELAKLNPKPIETLSAEEARQQPSVADAVKKVMAQQGKKPDEVGTVDNTSIKLEGHELKVRVYRPEGDGPFPTVLYIHGGGWVIATLDTYDATPRSLSKHLGALVVSIHYRQAPEHKFPAAHEDAFGAYQWLLKNAGKFKGDAGKIAVVGESAGGNMAVAVALMAKEKGLQLPVQIGAIYPVADVTNTNTPSYAENAQAKPLNKAMMEWFGKQTFATDEQKQNPRASLLLAGEELKGLPPTTIITAQIDPLRSEGEKLAELLKASGVKTTYQNFDGVTHEFFGMAAVVDKAKQAQDVLLTDLKTAFGK